ncbi:NINE protein [Streptomyces polyrhachis]|uniref:NINE protein n=1 Tax=Streptomyces polyrhachis TaxID=1282885 RepID=A0ABW2GC21_9ACTN
MSDQQPNPYGPQPGPYGQQPMPPGAHYGPQPGYGYPGAIPGAPLHGGYPPDPYAPYGYAPDGRPYSDKSKIVAGVLQLLVGCFGVGRFYTGHTGMALGQLFTCGGLGIWALVDGIILLVSPDPTDSDGRVLRG